MMEAKNLIGAMHYVKALIDARLSEQLEGEPFVLPEISVVADGSIFYHLIVSGSFCAEEYATLAIALVPSVEPWLFQERITHFFPKGHDLPEFGAVKGENSRFIIPTAETVLYLLAGDDVATRLELFARIFSSESIFTGEGILSLDEVRTGEPPMSGRLVISQEWLSKLLLNKEQPPAYGPEFPAVAVDTQLGWDNLVLQENTSEQLEDLKMWLEHNTALLDAWNMHKIIKPGYRALFYGPPGTGKTLTATLLGKKFGRDVFRIDLSQIVSKYIGETEKNLEKIFKKAVHKNWILFFDEADALFGKRTNVKDSHDRYANQEVSYLLQRLEDFPGLVILASNFKSNIDKAFMRRFNAVVHFVMPNAAERLKLWRRTLPAEAKLDNSIKLNEIAEKYELSGSAIVQAVHYVSLRAFSASDCLKKKNELLAGIRREFEKEDRVFK